MSYFTQFSSSGPAKITTYTSGTGNFTPISTNQSWARITLVGGGSGGAGGGSNKVGGKSGATLTWWQKLNLSTYSYSVGAGGTSGANSSGNAGGNTRFGTMEVLGAGIAALTNWIAVPGSVSVQNNPSGTLNSNNIPQNIALGGITVASGGTNAGQPGYTNALGNGGGGSAGQGSYPGGGGASSLYGFGGNGGDSFTGGNGNIPTAGNAGTGYGAGGGGGASDQNNDTVRSAGGVGSGGVIIIEEFIQ